MKHYTEHVRLLIDAASEAAGVEIQPADFLEALVKRLPAPQKRAVGVRRYQGLVPLSPAGLRELLAGARNRELSNILARVLLRVLGPDSTLRESYPIYVAFAKRLGLTPWSLPYYRRYAFGYVRRSASSHVLL